MHILYNIATHIATFFIWLSSLFNSKMVLFVAGRKHTFKDLSDAIKATDATIWFHCASLGEFEQGFPIMEAVKNKFPEHKLIVSFFSPSGYEIKKNTPIADVVVYLPLDSPKNAKQFITKAHPSVAIFVKYEFWPNYLFELEKQKIPVVLVSGLFRENQVFFKSYGNFMRKALRTFNHLFVQNKASQALLESIGIENSSISGDTRFDRVSHQIEQDNSLAFMDSFTENKLCIVCGSTWPEDDAVLAPYINAAPKNVVFVIAPHKIDPEKLHKLAQKLKKPTLHYSSLQQQEEASSAPTVIIIDTIGLLTKIYSYADIAYIGGAMGNTGLHNILEAATFGVPIVIGNNYDDFPEASRLQSLAGLFSISNADELRQIMDKLVEDANFRNKAGMIAGHFVNSNTGATAITMQYLETLLQPTP